MGEAWCHHLQPAVLNLNGISIVGRERQREQRCAKVLELR